MGDGKQRVAVVLVLWTGLLLGCAGSARPDAGAEVCVPGESSVDSLGKALFGSGEVLVAGQPGRVTVRWLEVGCEERTTVRATLTGPDGGSTPLTAASLTTPMSGVVEAAFDLTPLVAGTYLLEAFLEPGAIRTAVEVIVAADRTDTPVFEELVAASSVGSRFSNRWVARTRSGLLIVGSSLSRDGRPVQPPTGWPSSVVAVIAVRNTVWTAGSASSGAPGTIARWRDDGTQLVFDGAAPRPGLCHAEYASADTFICSWDDSRFEYHWSAAGLERQQVALVHPSDWTTMAAGRRFVVGRSDQPEVPYSVLCEEQLQTRERSCHDSLNLHGLSAVGPLVRNWKTNSLGVWGREGRGWWLSPSGLSPGGSPARGLVDDEAVALEPSFVNIDAPVPHEGLIMTANEQGLQFERYRLGPPLGVRAAPHQIVAILHDWIVVRRSGISDRAFFIARP